MVQVAGEGEIGFQDYFVRRRHQVPITGVRFDGAEAATMTQEVAGALAGADVIVIAPSNPIVSIGPVLAVPGVRELVEGARPRVVAVSPIVGGRALKGPADRMLSELGYPVSVTGIARIYRDLASTLVIDTSDRDLADQIEAEGVRCIVTDTVMRDAEVSAALGRTLLAGTGSW
jgi:LPPG:FO 2-phospho-L-lactate transferase